MPSPSFRTSIDHNNPSIYHIRAFCSLYVMFNAIGRLLFSYLLCVTPTVTLLLGVQPIYIHCAYNTKQDNIYHQYLHVPTHWCIPILPLCMDMYINSIKYTSYDFNTKYKKISIVTLSVHTYTFDLHSLQVSE